MEVKVLLECGTDKASSATAGWRWTPLPEEGVTFAEEAVLHLCRHTLNVLPLSAPLFGLRANPAKSSFSSSGRRRRGEDQGEESLSPCWLSPDQRLSELDPSSLSSLELRLRFKMPMPSKLHDLDRQAFYYYYRQIRHDFCRGDLVEVCTTSLQQLKKSVSARKNPWWLPPLPGMGTGGGTAEQQEEEGRVSLYQNVARLSSLAMTVDVLEENRSVKDVVGSAHQYYVPKKIYSSHAEKFIGSGKIKGLTENLVNDLCQRKISSTDLKKTFLREVEESFEVWFVETYPVRVHKGQESEKGRLVFRPPFKSESPPFEEREPVLEMETGQSTQDVLCALEDVCSISVEDDDGQEDTGSNKGSRRRWEIELARRNGVPVRLSLASKARMRDLVSHVAGYYRLCEKWTFSLSSSLRYPASVDPCAADNVHGPVGTDFAEAKFRQKTRMAPGTYLLRQSRDKYDLLYLHYLPDGEGGNDPQEQQQQQPPSSPSRRPLRLETLRIARLPFPGGGGGSARFRVAGGAAGVRTEEYSSLQELIRSLKRPPPPPSEGGRSDHPVLRDCVHPSENDRADTLLLCRSIQKLKSDVIRSGEGGPSPSSAAQHKSVVPHTQLSKFQNEIFPGRFTSVWRGSWQESRQSRKVVAIKQLREDHQWTKLGEFSQFCSESLLWEDGTLVHSLGVGLATAGEPMSLIQEYFHLGTLDAFLQKHGSQMEIVDLVEACASLARAVWYLEDRHSLGGARGHGRVRCSNVFVAAPPGQEAESGGAFRVKLGDAGMATTPYGPEEVHWLSYELLLQQGLSSAAGEKQRQQPQPMPTRQHCTVKGDVWALATTFWQIFSDGASPGEGAGGEDTDPETFRQAYLRGYTLAKPDKLGHHLTAMYRLMHECWHPVPGLRKDPQAVMRDVSQILYRVFNSKKVHVYATIAEDIGNGVGVDSDGDSSTLNGTANGQEEYGLGTGHFPPSLSPPRTTSTPLPMFNGGVFPSSPAATPLPPPPAAAAAVPGPSLPVAKRPSTAPPSTSTSSSITNGNGGPASANYSRLGNLVPTYNKMMERHLGNLDSLNINLLRDFGNFMMSAGRCDTSGSLDPLLAASGSINSSRPGSSMDGFVGFGSSALTSQTSLASFSTLCSMSSIYQLEQSQLELNTEFPLGEGNFGVVYKGVMSKSNGEWDVVAVKMLKDGSGSADTPPSMGPGGLSTDGDSFDAAAEEIQRELDIMKSLNHENVVKIKGVLQESSRVIIIMEYVPEGSLDRYLYAHRDSIKFPRQLFIFAQNIVEGMEYLGTKDILHRDLAARNILVANDELVKISDFGLARCAADQGGHYVMSTNTNIPVKWLALECLTHKLYSVPSDVWGFGVALWEMFSFGASPDLAKCEGFFRAGATEEQHQREFQLWLQYLDEGLRLPVPENCPASVYTEIMLPCWHKDPKKRPRFPELKVALKRIENQVT